MATVLDTSLLQFISPIFSFIFVFAVMYAVMDKFKLIGGNKGLHASIALAIAVMFLFAQDAVRFVNFITPWFVIMFVIGLFLTAFFVFFGVKPDTIGGVMKDARVYWTVIVLAIIVLFISIGQVFGSDLGSSDDDGDVRTIAEREGASEATTEGFNAIVHPRILGALFLLIIAAFAIRLISETMEK